MDLLLACMIGAAFGAGLAWLLARGILRKTEARLIRAERELEDVRAAHAKDKEELARMEARIEAERKASDEKLELLEETKRKLAESFQSLSSEALSKNNASFLDLARATLEKYQEGAKSDLAKREASIRETVKPVGEALSSFKERVEAMERERASAYSGLREQVKNLNQTQDQLSRTTGNLVQALRAPQVRGQWGEMQLRRTVEMAGMVNCCDFVEQASGEDEAGRQRRPDLLVRLPNDRIVVVDAKAPLAAYLDALENDDPDERTAKMRDHARQIRDHIKKLSEKAYWEQFDNAPEFIVLFLPNEAIFSAALEQDPELIEQGVFRQVILATPTTLIALLKAVAYGWQQEAITREARQISALGQELYDRIGVVTSHLAKLGKSLDRSVSDYNNAVRSVESRLLVTARKFEALESSSQSEMAAPKGVEKSPIAPAADEAGT
ncbi:MAG: DNA recombination protein RmuC [Opitutales bacterium]